jgi:hypothetical protein
MRMIVSKRQPLFGLGLAQREAYTTDSTWPLCTNNQQPTTLSLSNGNRMDGIHFLLLINDLVLLLC